MEETTAEQAELNKIKPELQTAVQKMFADQKLYQSAQNELVAKIKEIGDEEHKHGAEPTIDVCTITTFCLLAQLTQPGRYTMVQGFPS